MITIYSYDIAEGTLARPSMEELPTIFESENTDLWVDLEAPTPNEIAILRDVFDFHELAIEDCIDTDIEEAKIDDYEDYLFLVFHSVFFQSDTLMFDFIELDMFFGKNYVVTYHKKPTPGIKLLKKRLEKTINFMGRGSDEILHAIVDSLVDNYLASFKKLERAIFQIENEILSNATKNTFNNLFKIKRGLINLRRTLTPEVEVVESLGGTEYDLIQEENKIYFQDVHDHISNVEGRLRSYIEMVNGTMDSYVSITQHRMNSTMQALTVVATIVLLPTLITSIYGMNLDLPFQDNPHGFLIVTCFCMALVIFMLRYFKKREWF